MHKILKQIPNSFKKKGFWVALSVPLRALLDLLGLAVLLPVLIMVLDSASLMNVPLVSEIYSLLGFSSIQKFIYFLVSVILGFILFKTGLNLLLLNTQNRYLLSLYKYFSSNLFTSLYDRGLIFVKDSNSSEIAFKINAVCYNFVVSYLASILKIFGQSIFTIFLLTALTIYNPFSTLIVVLSLIPVILVYLLLVRKSLKKYGREEMNARREQQKIVQETFKGYAEMKVNNVFPHMKNKFDDGLKAISDYRTKNLLISSIPSYLLEIAVAVVVSTMVLFSMNADNPSMRVFLGVFTVAMLRLLPAVHSLISAWSTIKSTDYTLDLLDEYNVKLSDNSVENKTNINERINLTFNDKIKLVDLSFSYAETEIISNLNFEIKKGERFGIKGKTGSGKTTLFNLILGLLEPSEGAIFIDDKKLEKDNIQEWQKLVAYVPQDVFIADASLAENVALGCEKEKIDKNKVMEVLKKASLDQFERALPLGINTALGEAGAKISGGQRQRIGIARALYKNAKVLFFDEATSSLDTQTEREINEAIDGLSKENREITIVVISHRDSSLAICDRVFEINK